MHSISFITQLSGKVQVHDKICSSNFNSFLCSSLLTLFSTVAPFQSMVWVGWLGWFPTWTWTEAILSQPPPHARPHRQLELILPILNYTIHPHTHMLFVWQTLSPTLGALTPTHFNFIWLHVTHTHYFAPTFCYITNTSLQFSASVQLTKAYMAETFYHDCLSPFCYIWCLQLLLWIQQT